MAAHVLVADDEPEILTMVSEILKSRGYTYDLATDGLQALDFARRRNPDLLVTDVMMPSVDGWTLVRELRADPKLASLPVIFVTALGTKDDRLRAFRLGADDYINKPFQVRDLIARIDNALKRVPAVPSSPAIAMPAGLNGNLAQVGLSTLLVLVEMERKTGILQMRSPDGRIAKLSLRDGRIVDARLGALVGAECVYQLLTWTMGTFEFTKRKVEGPDQIQATTTHLLMEGARRSDEANATGHDVNLDDDDDAIAEWTEDERTPMMVAAKLAGLVQRSAHSSNPPPFASIPQIPLAELMAHVAADEAAEAAAAAAKAAKAPPAPAAKASRSPSEPAANATRSPSEPAAKAASRPEPAAKAASSSRPEPTAKATRSPSEATFAAGSEGAGAPIPEPAAKVAATRGPSPPEAATAPSRPAPREAAAPSHPPPRKAAASPPTAPAATAVDPSDIADPPRVASVAKRTTWPWLVFAIVAAVAGVATLFVPLGKATATDRSPQVQADAALAAVAIDQAAVLAHIRADGFAALPMLRAGIETDASTLQDMASNESLLKAAPDEIIEVFQTRDGRDQSVLRLPASAPSLGGDAVRHDGAKLWVVARADVKSQSGATAGAIAVAEPADLVAAKRALADHELGASLSTKPPLVLSAVEGDATTTIPLPTKTDLHLSLTIAAAAVAKSPDWLPIARLALFALAALLLAIFFTLRPRRSKRVAA